MSDYVKVPTWTLLLWLLECLAVGAGAGVCFQRYSMDDPRDLRSAKSCAILTSNSPDGKVAWLTWHDGEWRKSRSGQWYYDVSEVKLPERRAR